MDKSDEEYPTLRQIGVKGHPLLAPFHTLSELKINQFLVRNLIQRDVRSRYRNASLGYIWAVLEPALLACVYWFLFVMLKGNADELYPVWVLLGVIVWGCFSKSLSAATKSLTNNVQTLHLVYFPRAIFPVTAVGANLVVTLMSALIIFPILYVYDLPWTIHLLWVPVGIVWAAVMALGLGMMFAPFNCIQGDVQHMVNFLTRAGFFLSPVMWTAEMALERGAWGEAVLWNPMVVPITMVRHGLEGQSIGLPSWIIASSALFTILFYLVGTMIFARYEREAVKFL